jgi:hypothetical protein
MLVARAWPVALGRRSSAWRPATVRLRAVRCHSTSARGPRESGVAQWEAMPSGGQASVASYLAYLLEVNQSMNLTAVRNLDDAYERHVGDSLALLPVLDEAFASQQLSEGQPLSLMDVGSGCGVPGIILAAARPEWQVTAAIACFPPPRLPEVERAEAVIFVLGTDAGDAAGHVAQTHGLRDGGGCAQRRAEHACAMGTRGGRGPAARASAGASQETRV